MRVYIVTNSSGGFPQKLHETESLDVRAIAHQLQGHGHDPAIINHAAMIRLDPAQIRDAAIIYASSQYAEYNQYIENCLLYAEICGGRLLPNYLCSRALENKFVQELLKKKLGLRSPASELYGTIEEIAEKADTLEYPTILKYPQGFGGSTVVKIDSPVQLMAELRRTMVATVERPTGLWHAISERRQYLRRVAQFKRRYPLQTGRFILQEFLPNLGFDWKVLLFGNRLFCLKRFVRKGEFRASGSGNFSFAETPPAAVLDFASTVLRDLDAPWAALDIVEAGGNPYLLEFQCVHFGLYTLMRNHCYYYRDGGSWLSQAVADAVPEFYFAEAAAEYLAAHYPAT
jgi:glutathione synthase/RimK-type ligase-like ATP-grasp enzyme